MTDRPAHHRRRPSSESAELPKKFSRCPIEPEAWEMALELLRLSPLQADIVVLLVQEASEVQVATELGLTPETVRTMLADILLHTGIRSRTDLVGIIRSM